VGGATHFRLPTAAEATDHPADDGEPLAAWCESSGRGELVGLSPEGEKQLWKSVLGPSPLDEVPAGGELDPRPLSPLLGQGRGIERDIELARMRAQPHVIDPEIDRDVAVLAAVQAALEVARIDARALIGAQPSAIAEDNLAAVRRALTRAIGDAR